jgi:hypothetical protein
MPRIRTAIARALPVVSGKPAMSINAMVVISRHASGSRRKIASMTGSFRNGACFSSARSSRIRVNKALFTFSGTTSVLTASALSSIPCATRHSLAAIAMRFGRSRQ